MKMKTITTSLLFAIILFSTAYAAETPPSDTTGVKPDESKTNTAKSETAKPKTEAEPKSEAAPGTAVPAKASTDPKSAEEIKKSDESKKEDASEKGESPDSELSKKEKKKLKKKKQQKKIKKEEKKSMEDIYLEQKILDGPTTYYFGKVKSKTKGKTGVFVIKNTGTADLIIKKVVSTKKPFIVTQPKLKTIPPGSKTTFQITFFPNTGGNKKAIIKVINNDTADPYFMFKVSGISIGKKEKPEKKKKIKKKKPEKPVKKPKIELEIAE
jgi:hypothetical protein